MSTSVDAIPKGVALDHEKVNEADVYEDETKSLEKNSRAVSSWTIVASALANFSDGYQNNLVRFERIVLPQVYEAHGKLGVEHKRHLQASGTTCLYISCPDAHLQCPSRRRSNRYRCLRIPLRHIFSQRWTMDHIWYGGDWQSHGNVDLPSQRDK